MTPKVDLRPEWAWLHKHTHTNTRTDRCYVLLEETLPTVKNHSVTLWSNLLFVGKEERDAERSLNLLSHLNGPADHKPNPLSPFRFSKQLQRTCMAPTATE